jgi:mannose-P-dolichol utilization defect protein 1
MAFGILSQGWRRARLTNARTTCQRCRSPQHPETKGTLAKEKPITLRLRFLHGLSQRLRAQLVAAAPVQHLPQKRRLPLELVSSLVGWLVIVGSALYKLPQLVRIWRVGSAKGISVTTYVCETLSIAFSLCYALRNGFPFNTFGESGFILLQNLMIIILMSHFDARPGRLTLLALLGCIGILMAALLSPSLAPSRLVAATQAISIPLLNVSRIPQIVLNARTKTTGELSITTLLLQLLGNAARLFTTLVQLEGNLLYLLSSMVAFLLNTILVYQYIRFSPAASG